MHHDLGTASAWLVALFWHTVPMAGSKVVYHQFIAYGPSGGAWSLNGHFDRLPPGWFSAEGRADIREEAELEPLDPAAGRE